MIENLPEEFLRDVRGARLVGVRKVVAARRRGPAHRTQRPGVQRQNVADIIQTNGMRELCEEQPHELAPVRKGAGQSFRSLFPYHLREHMTRDEVAHLPEHRPLAADRWSRAIFR